MYIIIEKVPETYSKLWKCPEMASLCRLQSPRLGALGWESAREIRLRKKLLAGLLLLMTLKTGVLQSSLRCEEERGFVPLPSIISAPFSALTDTNLQATDCSISSQGFDVYRSVDKHIEVNSAFQLITKLTKAPCFSSRRTLRWQVMGQTLARDPWRKNYTNQDGPMV